MELLSHIELEFLWPTMTMSGMCCDDDEEEEEVFLFTFNFLFASAYDLHNKLNKTKKIPTLPLVLTMELNQT